MSSILNDINDAMWFVPFFLIVAIGIYATVRFKGIQFTKLGEAFRVTFRRGGDDYSAVRVFFVSMASRIGAGNITGPILAVTAGGPGSIFWMWVFAIIGSATSFLETTVCQIYKERNPEGGYSGGQAYNILHALCRPKLALAIALLLVVMEFVGFASMEGCTISEAVGNGLPTYLAVMVVIGLAAILAYVMAGGYRRVSSFANKLVPIMVLMWVAVCILSMALSKGGIGNAFAMIFQCAFNVPALVAGGAGTMLVVGMKRGILSNEAGLGTTTYISSKAEVKHPAMQGLTQSMGVLLDTAICTLTALVILSYGSYEEIMATGMQSQELLQHVFQCSLGDSAAFLVMIFVTVFTFSSMMGSFTVGMANLEFFSKKKTAYIAACCVMLASFFISAAFASDDMFVVLDMLLAVTATVNCVTLFLIGKRAVAAYTDYFRQKSEGVEDPVFRKSVLGDDTGVTAWD